jgi:two-component system, OmpR family, aerobic respiration control protein ArcA
MLRDGLSELKAMAKKRLNAKDLIEKITKLARERMLAEPVIAIDSLKSLKRVQPATILVVEDDDIVRKSLQRIFSADGYNVVAVQNAAELTDVLSESSIDLILLDVGLPWVNGFELAEMIKNHPEMKSIPLVFLSGHSDQEMIRKGFSVGAHDYITKPFEIETVKKTVKTLLDA